VKDALALLGPSSQSTLLDWIKRSAFVFGGITVTLGVQLLIGPKPAGGQILAFVIFLVISTAFFVPALTADIPRLRRQLFRRR
jgi:hypothetical protein